MEIRPIPTRFGDRTQLSLNKLEASVFANAGMPGRFLQSTGLWLQAALLLPEEDRRLTVTLPTAALPRSQRKLFSEAERLERFFQNTPPEELPSIATPQAIANMWCMGEALGVYYGHRVGAIAIANVPDAVSAAV